MALALAVGVGCSPGAAGSSTASGPAVTPTTPPTAIGLRGGTPAAPPSPGSSPPPASPTRASCSPVSSSNPALAIRSEDRHFALYYGWPSAVNGAGGVIGRAVETFTRFPVVVFGDKVQLSSHPDYQNTVKILQQVAASGKTRIFGYVDLGVRTQNLAVAAIGQSAQAWQQLGAQGIFLDDAGSDFGVDANRRDAAVDALHRLGLKVILNANNPDDAFRGKVPLGAGDGYLFESFQVSDGRMVSSNTSDAKADKALRYGLQTGADIYAVATGPGDEAGFADKFTYAWWSSLLYGFPYFQYTTIDYGASQAQLPYYPQDTPDLGTRYVEEGVRHGGDGLHRRYTDRGEVQVQGGANPQGRFVPCST